jgi:hypothetical protein
VLVGDFGLEGGEGGATALDHIAIKARRASTTFLVIGGGGLVETAAMLVGDFGVEGGEGCVTAFGKFVVNIRRASPAFLFGGGGGFLETAAAFDGRLGVKGDQCVVATGCGVGFEIDHAVPSLVGDFGGEGGEGGATAPGKFAIKVLQAPPALIFDSDGLVRATSAFLGRLGVEGGHILFVQGRQLSGQRRREALPIFDFLFQRVTPRRQRTDLLAEGETAATELLNLLADTLHYAVSIVF